MNLLLCKCIPKNWVSRAKTLLKRRKKAISNRPISAKKLQQQRKLFSYSKQYRALQIQKQLNRRTYSSQHINQLMDQIFYPDVVQAHQQAAKIHFETSTLKQYNIDNYQNDKHIQQISQITLATQLIQYYLQHREQLQIQHIVILCQKLQTYFWKKDKIKANIQRKWAKMNQNMKKKDKNYKDKKCPHIFIDKQDTFHYLPWNQMIDSFVLKLNDNLNENQQDFIPNILIFSQILQSIKKAINYIPLKLYQLFQKKIINLTFQQIDSLQLQQCDNLIKIFALKSSVRYPVHTVITNFQPQLLAKYNRIKQTIIQKVIQHPKISGQQLGGIIKCLKYGIIQFTQQIGNKLKNGVLVCLVELPFEKVVDLLQVYLKNSTGSDLQFIQLIKFDVLRKCSNAVSKKHLFKCINFVDNKNLKFYLNLPTQNNNTKIYGQDLLIQCTNMICSKYCGTNTLTFSQVTKYILILYKNKISDINILQLISNQIIKLKQQIDLLQLTQSLFKINLLGYRSPILAQILMKQYEKKYHDIKKIIKQKEKQVKLLPGQKDKKLQNYYQNQIVTQEQLVLEQNLMICLWLLFSTHAKQNKSISVDSLMKIYPLVNNSKHPLIYQLSINLNNYTKKLGILWQIKQIASLTKNTTIRKNRLDQYYNHDRQYNIAIRTMYQQSQQTDQFILTYHIKNKQFIPSAWSYYQVYNIENYVRFVKNRQNGNKNYFSNKDVSEQVSNLRKQVIQGYEEEKKNQDNRNITGKQGEKEQKIYQLDSK